MIHDTVVLHYEVPLQERVQGYHIFALCCSTLCSPAAATLRFPSVRDPDKTESHNIFTTTERSMHDRMVAFAVAGTIHVWNAGSLPHVMFTTYSPLTKVVTTLCFSKDARTLFYVERDRMTQENRLVEIDLAYCPIRVIRSRNSLEITEQIRDMVSLAGGMLTLVGFGTDGYYCFLPHDIHVKPMRIKNGECIAQNIAVHTICYHHEERFLVMVDGKNLVCAYWINEHTGEITKKAIVCKSGTRPKKPNTRNTGAFVIIKPNGSTAIVSERHRQITSSICYHRELLLLAGPYRSATMFAHANNQFLNRSIRHELRLDRAIMQDDFVVAINDMLQCVDIYKYEQRTLRPLHIGIRDHVAIHKTHMSDDDQEEELSSVQVAHGSNTMIPSSMHWNETYLHGALMFACLIRIPNTPFSSRHQSPSSTMTWSEPIMTETRSVTPWRLRPHYADVTCLIGA